MFNFLYLYSFFTTVKSSLFVGYQCSWLSWVAIAYECSQKSIKSICLIFIYLIPNLLPTKLRTRKPGKVWLPTNIDPANKNDSTVYIRCNSIHFVDSLKKVDRFKQANSLQNGALVRAYKHLFRTLNNFF